MLQMPKRSLCDLVLDTIDIISARKNRPNLVRIYRHLHRLYDLSLSTCESLLQSLLKEGRVIRVTYKGNISYRNALKWKKYSYYMKKTMGSELPGTILTKAISELVVQEPDYLNMGVPCKILEEHLLSMKDDNINRETIHKLLQRELKHESLLQLDNGNYFLGPKPPETSLFDGEEVDLKFEKTKKVRTYKHDIKRFKNKTIESINSSSFILQNNNLSEVNDLSDTEELKPSNLTTDIEEFKPSNLTTDIEEFKPSNLTTDIEQFKPNLTTDIEELKPNLTTDIEELKPNLTTDIEEFKPSNLITDIEEFKPSNLTTDIEQFKPNLTTDIKCIKNEELDIPITPDETSENQYVNATVTDDKSCNPIIIKLEESVEQSEESSNNALKNESVIVVELSESTKKEKEELNGELKLMPLEELVGTESSSSQAMDSEDSGSNPNDKSLIEEQYYNSPVQEENEEVLSLESSDDSFSLSISDVDTMNSPLGRTTPSDVNLVKNDKYKLSITQNDSEVNKDNVNDSRPKCSPFKADCTSNGQKICNSVDKVKKKVKRIQPVVERVQRKKRTKYDASEYYFPSLKRKTRESTSENDKKEDKRRKKRKKDNGVGCLSGIFAKRVMFPGNTSMCCECNCYISKVKLDPMIFCTTCANQGHQSCAQKTMTGTDWHCVGCRSENISPVACTACNKLTNENDRGELHSCTRCGECYHKDCHSLKIKVRPSTSEWYCFKCTLVEDSSKVTNDSPLENIEKTNSESNESSTFQNERLANNTFQFLKEEPPDYRNWSAEEVYNYFKVYMDEEAAKAFMDQDIDGYALKLMGRSDVLNLGLKLGPSLKVLFHVRRLQLGSNSLMDIWNN